jgi:hypothetical protein
MRHLTGKRELDQIADDVAEVARELGSDWAAWARQAGGGPPLPPPFAFAEVFERTTARGQSWTLEPGGEGDYPRVTLNSELGNIWLLSPSQGRGWYSWVRSHPNSREAALLLNSRVLTVQVDPEFRNLANSVRAQLCQWVLVYGERHGVELVGIDFDPVERDPRPTGAYKWWLGWVWRRADRPRGEDDRPMGVEADVWYQHIHDLVRPESPRSHWSSFGVLSVRGKRSNLMSQVLEVLADRDTRIKKVSTVYKYLGGRSLDDERFNGDPKVIADWLIGRESGSLVSQGVLMALKVELGLSDGTARKWLLRIRGLSEEEQVRRGTALRAKVLRRRGPAPVPPEMASDVGRADWLPTTRKGEANFTASGADDEEEGSEDAYFRSTLVPLDWLEDAPNEEPLSASQALIAEEREKWGNAPTSYPGPKVAITGEGWGLLSPPPPDRARHPFWDDKDDPEPTLQWQGRWWTYVEPGWGLGSSDKLPDVDVGGFRRVTRGTFEVGGSRVGDDWHEGIWWTWTKKEGWQDPEDGDWTAQRRLTADEVRRRRPLSRTP